MQSLYEDWDDIFLWGEPLSFIASCKHWNDGLLNGVSLRNLGRSTAMEFWQNRTAGNYVRVVRATGSISELGQNAYSYFYVMKTQKKEN
eukprot:3060524-Karenia_brevis.AAC.1